MTANDLAALAVLAVNIGGAVSGALAARAWWPRHHLSSEPRSTRIFYASVIGLMAAFAGNAAVQSIWMIANWPPAIRLADCDDILWRTVGGAACVGMVLAKLLALPPEERCSWNIVTVVFHPDSDQIVVRIYHAAARRMRRRKG